MLAVDVLITELQRFADPAAPVFAGWPTDRVTARRRWAGAFATYLDDAVDTAPPLTPNGITLDFSRTEDAFFTTLELDNGSIDAAAVDFATAWRAAIDAIDPGASASDASSTSFTFAAMDPTAVASRFDSLRDQLVAAFRSGAATRRIDLEQIATALHTATTGLASTPTPFVVTYG